MISKKKYLFILLVFIFIGNVYAKNVLEEKHEVNSTWYFLKVSQKDLLGNSSKDTLRSLNTLYEQVKITLDNEKLAVNNFLLEEPQICSIDYIKINQTPLSHFYSQKTVNLYEALFKEENIPLASNINILTASTPELACEAPYSEIIQNDDYLVVIDKYHVIFFTKQPEQDNKVSSKKYQFRDDFPTYCQDVNKGQIFDGSSKYVCQYPNMSMPETYGRIKEIINDGQYMNKNLPKENTSYSVQDTKITYQWMARNILKLIIDQDAEKTTYLFEEKKDNTILIITIDTGY